VWRARPTLCQRPTRRVGIKSRSTQPRSSHVRLHKRLRCGNSLKANAGHITSFASMAAPSHYIRTIHSSFAAHSASSWGSHNALFDLGGIMNQYPPGLGYGPQEVPYRAVGRRRPPHSAPFESSRRPSVHTPKPMHALTFQSSHNKFDPFADENSLELVRPISLPSLQTTYPSSFQRRKSPPLPAPSTSQLAPRSAPWPPSTSNSATVAGIVDAPAPPSAIGNRDARAKLVAGILLNRVHAVGRPMRRRCFSGEPREYVRSRLSSVVTADV
jgi:hypothetical protein